jgi:hypothetical protein
MGKMLHGMFTLRITGVRNCGYSAKNKGTHRYIAEDVHTGRKVSVKFRNFDVDPQKYVGMTGEFDGDDNDIQDSPEKYITSGRNNKLFKNPFFTEEQIKNMGVKR